MPSPPSPGLIRTFQAAYEKQKKARRVSVAELAKDLGRPDRTIRDWVKKENEGYWARYLDKEPAPDQLTQRVSQLQAELSAVKRERDEFQREAWDFNAVKEIIGNIVAGPTRPPDWVIRPAPKSPSSEVPMMIWSDWHGGEVVSRVETNGQNEFSSKIMERRVRRLVETTIHLCKHHGPGKYPGAVINLLGDFVSGGLHPELAKSDDKSSIESSLHVRDVLVWALEEMAEYFGRLYIPCVAGNHGRNTHRPEFKRYVYQNFDWLIYQMLVRHFAGRKNIIFDVPDSNEVHYQVFGKRYLAMHGDMLGVKGGDGIIGSIGPITRGEMKVGKQSSAFGRDYDYLLMGHWHQPLWLPRIVVANSLKGFDEYAAKALRAPPSIPSQPLWFVHPTHGHTTHREVYLEDPVREQANPWVSFAKAAA